MSKSKMFLFAVQNTLEEEGVFSDVADDPGGKTKYGITEYRLQVAIADGVVPYVTIQNLSIPQAIEIYHAYYWLELRLDKILSPYIAAEIFDSAVNCGTGTGVKFAQRAYNFCRMKGGEDLKDDGVLGPISRYAINNMAEKYETPLLIAMNGEQYKYYDTISDNREQFHTFTRGWTKRLHLLNSGYNPNS